MNKAALVDLARLHLQQEIVRLQGLLAQLDEPAHTAPTKAKPKRKHMSAKARAEISARMKAH